MDHKILTRTTTNGNTAILVVVESFTGFVHLIPVKNTTTETTAEALINNVIPLWGVGWTLYSDKAPSFMSGLFFTNKDVTRNSPYNGCNENRES